MAQGKQGEAFGSKVSSQCAHRRVMPPDPRDGCVRELRSDAQLSSGQGWCLSQQLPSLWGRTWERGRSSEGPAIAMLLPAQRCSSRFPVANETPDARKSAPSVGSRLHPGTCGHGTDGP